MSSSKDMAQTLGQKIHNLLLSKGWRQADLARRVWPGETKTDARGYQVPRGTDRISAYINDKAVPEPATLKRIAKAFGIEVDDLVPGALASPHEKETPSLSISVLPGAPDRCLLRVNKLLPLSVALQIAEIINKHDAK